MAESTNRCDLPFLPTIEARLITRSAAAAYLSVTPRHYDRLVKQGKVPGYVPGFLRIDRVALDQAISALTRSGLGGTAPAEAPMNSLQRWSKARAERKARRGL